MLWIFQNFSKEEVEDWAARTWVIWSARKIIKKGVNLEKSPRTSGWKPSFYSESIAKQILPTDPFKIMSFVSVWELFYFVVFLYPCYVFSSKLWIPFRCPFWFGHWNRVFWYRLIPAFHFGFTANIIYIYIICILK